VVFDAAMAAWIALGISLFGGLITAIARFAS
jgi:hypothetical protein